MHKFLLCVVLALSSNVLSMDLNDQNTKNYLINEDGSKTHISTLIILSENDQLDQLLSAGANPDTICRVSHAPISLMGVAISVGNSAAAKILFDRGAIKPIDLNKFSQSYLYNQIIQWYDEKTAAIMSSANIPLIAACMTNDWDELRRILKLGVVPNSTAIKIACKKEEALKILYQMVQERKNPAYMYSYPKETIDLIEKHYAKNIQNAENNSEDHEQPQSADILNGANDNDAVQLPNMMGNLQKDPLIWRTWIFSQKSAFICITTITLGALAYKYAAKWFKKKDENKNQPEEKKQGSVNA